MANHIVTVESVSSNLIPALKSQGVEALLPKHITIETFVKSAAIAIASNPDLQQADERSVILSLVKAAKDGLVCDNREAALVVFNTKVPNTNQWVKAAQYMPMVSGIIMRAKQSGMVSKIAAKAVYENDEFDYWMDENGEHLKYRPAIENRGELRLAFAMAVEKNGELSVAVLNREDIQDRQNASKTGNSANSPWVKWRAPMAEKSALHTLCKRLPNSSELMNLLEAGNEMEWQQGNIINEMKTIIGQEVHAAQLRSQKKPTPQLNVNMDDLLNSPVPEDQPQNEQDITITAETGVEAVEMPLIDNDSVPTFFESLCDTINGCDTVEQLQEIGFGLKENNKNGKITNEEYSTLRTTINACINEMKANQCK